MAEIKLTAAQEKAVNYGDGNLLLSAAAGSGKTATLSTRIAQLIVEGRGRLSRMLIVTFTRASAGEMRERISRRLREASEKYRGVDAEISARIGVALAELPSAEISTIHAFLYKALKPYFGSLGLSADGRIVEQQVSDALKKECMKAVVDEYFQDGGDLGEDFASLADVIGQVRDATSVDDELLWLAERLTGSGQDSDALYEYANKLDAIAVGDVDIMHTEFGLPVKKALVEFANHWKNVLDYYGEEMPWEEDVWQKYGENCGYMREWLKDLLDLTGDDSTSFAAYSSHFSGYATPKLGILSAKKQTELSGAFKAHRDGMKKDIGKILENFFSSTVEESRLAAEKTAGILRLCGTVLGNYSERLKGKKRSLSILDYGDLEEYATKLFLKDDGSVTETAREAGKKYDYIFIDEYQDTNRVQDRIFCAVAENGSRFIVGDIKQSIYRFRGANPEVFAEYRREWNGSEAGDSLFMSENFRCDSPVIDFVNMVSGYTLTKTDIPYDKEDELVCGKTVDYEPCPVEICLLPKGETENKYSTDLRERNPEAWYVASRIHEMIGRYSPDGRSVLQPSDVAVILRSPSSVGQDYVEALALHGIPAAMKTSKALDEYTSVMLIICILRTVNNPLEDVYLAGALRSPLFGFDATDLVTLRELAGEMPLYYGLLESVGDDGRAESAFLSKCTNARAWIREQKLISDGVAVDKYLEHLLESAKIRSMGGIRGNGSETDAIRRFTALAKTFETTASDGKSGIGGFLEYLENALAGKDSLKDSSGEGQVGTVQVISIHASKGLEFPVVFLSECAKQRNTKDEQRTVLYDIDIGLGMYLPDETGLTRSDNFIRRAIGEKIRTESVAEEMRMLYVALTRAKNRLIVTGKTKDGEAQLRDAEWEAAFGDTWSVGHSVSYLDWILQAASLCKNNKCYEIRLPEDCVQENGEASAESPGDSDEMDAIGEEAGKLKERFDETYRWEYLESIPAKLTVSRLHPEILDEYEMNTEALAEPCEDIAQEEAKRPSFMTGREEEEGRKRGNATHKFLQFVRFGDLKEYGFETELNRLVGDGYLSENEGRLIHIPQIERLRRSLLMEKILRSSFVKREFRFNHRMDASDFTDDEEKKVKLKENGVKITVQGVVDCVYRDPDDGGLVLVDYKTDSLTKDEWENRSLAEEKLRSRHGNQLKYYSKICRELFEEEISRVYIYSTVLGKLIRV